MKVGSKSLLVCETILFITFGLAWAVTREPVSISGQVTLTEQPPFLGEATLAVGCDTFSGDVTVTPLKLPYEKDGVTHYPEIMHEFDFGDGNTLNTIGAEFAVPTDENPAISTLHGNMEIVAGTGVFEGASGELRVNGQMDWSTGQATFEAHGMIAGYGG